MKRAILSIAALCAVAATSFLVHQHMDAQARADEFKRALAEADRKWDAKDYAAASTEYARALKGLPESPDRDRATTRFLASLQAGDQYATWDALAERNAEAALALAGKVQDLDVRIDAMRMAALHLASRDHDYYYYATLDGKRVYDNKEIESLPDESRWQWSYRATLAGDLAAAKALLREAYDTARAQLDYAADDAKHTRKQRYVGVTLEYCDILELTDRLTGNVVNQMHFFGTSQFNAGSNEYEVPSPDEFDDEGFDDAPANETPKPDAAGTVRGPSDEPFVRRGYYTQPAYGNLHTIQALFDSATATADQVGDKALRASVAYRRAVLMLNVGLYGNAQLNAKLTDWRNGSRHEPAISRDPRPLLQRLLRDHKGSAYDDEARFLLGYVAYYLNDFDTARSEFAQLEKDHPKSNYIGEARRLVQVIEYPQLFSSFDSRALIRPGEALNISVYARNVERVEIRLRPINLGKLLADAKGAEHVFADLAELEKLPGFEGALGVSVMDQSFALSPQKKHFYEYRDGLPIYTSTPGVYLLEVKGGPVTERKLLQVADLALTRRRTAAAEEMWLTTGNGTPLEGALLRGGYHENLYVSVPYQAEVPRDANDPSKGTHRVVQYRNERRMIDHPFTDLTDERGLATFAKVPYGVRNFWCVIETAQGTFLVNDKHAPLRIEDAPSWAPVAPPSPTPDIACFVYTDRPVYRPGDSAHLKLIARLPMGAGRLEGERALLRVMHDGIEQFRAELTLNDFGSALARFDVPHGAPVGDYSILVDNPRFGGSQSFKLTVLEYFKKDVRIAIDAATKPLIPGSDAEIVSRFSYLAGGWVQGGDVTVKVTAQPVGLGAFQAAAGKGRTNLDGEFRLMLDTAAISKSASGRFARLIVTVEGTGPGGQMVNAQAEMQLSGSGLSVSCEWPKANWVDARRLELRLTVSNGAGERLPVKGEYAIHRITDQSSLRPAEWRNPSLRLEGTSAYELSRFQDMVYIGIGNRSGRFRIVVSGTAAGESFVQSHELLMFGSGMPENAPFAIVPEFNESDATAPMRLLVCQPAAGNVVLTRHRDGTDYESVVVNAAPFSVLQHQVQDTDAPHYHLVARAIRDGALLSARTELTVRPASRRINVAVRFDKDSYLPGEEATADIFALDRHGKGVRAEVALSVWDSALREFATPALDSKQLYDHFFAGVTRYVADDRVMHTQTTVAATRRAEIKLTRWKIHAMPPGSFFYGSLSWLTTQTVDLVSIALDPARLAEKFRYSADAEDSQNESPMPDGVANDPYYGLGGGGGGGADKGGSGGMAHRRARGGGGRAAGSDLPDRSNFRDSAFFNGRLLTDENGAATVTFTLPDNLTEWSFEAIGIDKLSAVGQRTGSFKVAKPASVRMVGPRALTEGDEVELCALVQNLAAVPLVFAADIALNLDGHTATLKLLSAASPAGLFSVEGGRTQEVRFRVKVEGTGSANLRVALASDDNTALDNLVWRYSVQPRGVPVMTVTRFAFDENATTLAVMPNVHSKAIAGRTSAEVHFDGGLLSQLVDALPGLVNYPYGCAEQTMNRFVPLLAVLDVLRANELSLYDISRARMSYNGASPADNWPAALTDQAEIQKMVNVGFGNLRRYQNNDGGWGWFGGDGSSPHLSATVLLGMADARRLSRTGGGISLPASDAVVEKMLRHGVEFVLNMDHARQDDAVSARALRAAAEALKQLPAESTEGKPAEFKTRAQRLQAVLTVAMLREKQGAAAWANLALAAHHSSRQRDAQACIKQLNGLAVRQGMLLQFPAASARSWHDTGTEAQADAVEALATVAPATDEARGAVAGLSSARRGGGWGNTRATGSAMRALAAWMSASPEQSQPVQVQVDFAKLTVGSYQRSGGTKLEPRTRFALPAAEFAKSPAAGFSLKRTGKGSVTGSVVVRSLLPVSEFTTGQNNGLSVTRGYYRRTSTTREVEVEVQDNRGNVLRNYTETRIVHEHAWLNSGEELKVGDVVTVRILVGATAGDRYLCIEDQRPPCLEPISNRYDLGGGRHKTRNGTVLTREERDHSTNFFVQEATGSISIEYDCVVVAGGKFTALPTRAFDMYNEDRNGYSDAEQLTVTTR